MNLIKRVVKYHLDFAKNNAVWPLVIVFGIIGGFVGANHGDSDGSRAAVFFIVALVLLSEFIAIVGHTKSDRWDNLAISMALVRVSVINYFFSLGLNFSYLVDFPTHWWTVSRTIIGVTAAVALFFMVQEDFSAWESMSVRQRIWNTAVVTLYVACVITIAYLW